jgi:hypothetical protein
MITPTDRRRVAVATPYVAGEDVNGEPVIHWEWNYCPDCGVTGAHEHNGEPVNGVRCG